MRFSIWVDVGEKGQAQRARTCARGATTTVLGTPVVMAEEIRACADTDPLECWKVPAPRTCAMQSWLVWVRIDASAAARALPESASTPIIAARRNSAPPVAT